MSEQLRGPIELTKEEHELISGGSVDDIKVKELMREKGLEIKDGYIKVLIDGEERFMETGKNDLGTIHEEKKIAA